MLRSLPQGFSLKCWRLETGKKLRIISWFRRKWRSDEWWVCGSTLQVSRPHATIKKKDLPYLHFQSKAEKAIELYASERMSLWGWGRTVKKAFFRGGVGGGEIGGTICLLFISLWNAINGLLTKCFYSESQQIPLLSYHSQNIKRILGLFFLRQSYTVV